MVDLVLHPGHSKCGSTTIQDFIFENREIFRKRGVFLPDLNFNFPHSSDYQFDLTHTPRDYLAKIQAGKVPLSDLEHKLDDMIERASEQGCRRVIISAENLINAISGKITSEIHSLFNRKFNKVRVVYYIRRQDSLLISAWQQWGHKTGISLDDYIKKMSRTKFGDFLFITRNLKKLYSGQTIKVCPLSRKAMIGGNLLADFCSRAQINTNGLELNLEASNSGLSSALCTTLSSISDIYSDVHDQKIKSIITELTPNSILLRDKKYSTELSQEVKELLFNKFQESNKILAKNHFPKIDFDETLSLSSLIDKPTNEIDSLRERITKLEDLCALQMDMILQLNNSKG
ncbi:hypothetical protein MK852_17120 [Shewanella benthica]|uniref:hypothetical protein n=1 Tax=Shewanella benthica TaxID=43661 RepID=UPI0018797AF2|nr:hypothetical protein [Shewanella benthica]MBE7213947.1 hypothetical protein [Shewanella benthica]MCL1063836.1 hypothetical protein [Shewanella benthica]